MGEEELDSAENSKKGRHRKKQLYNSILHQMEFYFSDSNLSKDRFLSQLLEKDNCVDISVFLSFNKIRKIGCTVEDIQKAISKSDIIELTEDKLKIKRKFPMKPKTNTDDCTIYVENLKTNADHDWLTQVFSDFGNVTYVSIPKYKHSKANKGFAFVEFEKEAEAQAALEFFENIGCKMPVHTNPEELTSIRTFESNIDDDLTETSEDVEIKTEGKKRKISSDEEERADKPEKKMKIDLDQDKNDSTEAEELDNENKKKKKHKKDKKKNHIKELGLRVLSKKDWKKLRNAYLNMQRKKMKEFKNYLHKQRTNQQLCKPIEDEKVKKEDKHAKESNLEFTPGVIVKLKLQEIYEDPKKLKLEIKASNPDMQYVDLPVSFVSPEAFVRFSTNDAAKKFCKQKSFGEKLILEGEEEKLYWEKIQKDKTKKFMKNTKKNRGKCKLLQTAEKEGAKHLRFEDID